MNNQRTSFATLKLGQLTLECVCHDSQLWFRTSPLLKTLDFEGLTLEAVVYSGQATDSDGHLYDVVSEEGLYFLLLQSTAKKTLQFRNWVSQCVLPAALLDRNYSVGEEKSDDRSAPQSDPKAECPGVADAHLFWLAETVLPDLSREGKFYANLECEISDFAPPAALDKRQMRTLKSYLMWASFNLKCHRLAQQPSRNRYVRLTNQFSRLRYLKSTIADGEALGFLFSSPKTYAFDPDQPF